MMMSVFNDAKYLETLTGLDRLYEETEEAMASIEVDWEEEEEEEE